MDIFYLSRKRISLCAAILMSLHSSASYAGGVGLGATRIIYPAETKQAALAVTNTDKKNVFLLQSWVESAEGLVTQDFAITPPLFVIKKQSENTLRLVYGGPPLPEDRETLFWVNVKAIPSTDKEATEGKNQLRLAVVSRIKMFYRPEGLSGDSRDAALNMKVNRVGEQVLINNPSAYFVNLVQLKVGTQQLENTMVGPYSEVKVDIPMKAAGEISYSFVSDYGGVVKVK